MKNTISIHCFLFVCLVTSAFAQDPVPSSYNQVKTEVVKLPGIKDEAAFSALNITDKITGTFYTDGFGRPLATVGLQLTPVRHDIIQLYAYDALGRTDTLFLPFAAPSSNGAFIRRATSVVEQKSFYNDSGDKVADDAAPFAVSVYDNSPLSYLKEQGAPGSDWQPGTKTKLQTFRTNVANEFRIWKTDLTSSAFYDASTLFVNETTDENGNKVVTVTDRSGKLLEKHVQADASTWLKTLYIYDEVGRIKFILQPEGVRLLGSGTTISTSDDQSFQFTYDAEGRIAEKKTPGAAPIFYGYDPLGRLVLMQDGNLRPLNKWVYIKYDRNNRPIIQGLYLNTTHTSRTAIQQNVLDVLSYATGENFYEKKLNGGDHGYTNNSFPTTDSEVLAVTYYDNYDLDANGTADYSYTTQGLTNEKTAFNPLGKTTATKVKVLNTANWIISYVFYSEKGQVIQIRSNNHLSSALDNLVTNVYDFNGRLKLKKTYHNTGGANNVTVLNRYNYDHAGRLIEVFQKNNSDAEVEIASYRYNDIGQLTGKNLHCTTCTEEVIDPNGTIYAYNIVRSQYNSSETELVAYNSVRLVPPATGSFNVPSGSTLRARITGPSEKEAIESGQYLQSIDYRYNIRGWITSINNAQLTKDGRNDDVTDLFGMEFLYNLAEAGLNDQSGDERYWNGNISAMKWKGPGKSAGIAGTRSYKYKYDKADRLLNAKFQAIGITAWSDQLNSLNETMTYDHNGNIKTLVRNQRKHEWAGTEAFYTSDPMDNLTYTYKGSGNLLVKVEDSSGSTLGFTNAVNDTTEYTYNIAGNMLTDKNKGITSNIVYNFLGKPEQITLSGSRVLNYTYDASGNKLKMSLTQGGTTTTTDYVNGFMYEGGSLSYFGSPEGRVVKNQVSNQWEYQYAITDNLGNTRLVISSVTPAPAAPLATFEGDSEDKSPEYNVNSSFVVTSTSANHTPSGSKVVKMNQTYQIGPHKSVAVFPGDAVDMEVWTYFEGTSGWGSTNTGVTAWITSVAGAFNGVSGGSPEQQTIYNGVNSAIGTFGMAANQGNSQPTAYLNYILFDKNYKLLDMGWTAVPASANFSKQKISIPTKNITEPGFMFVYLSYEAESNNWVYFDDFKVTHTKTKVIQYNEYYPFGLSAATSWTREGNKNDFLFNAGNELNSNSGWYEMFFRGYDPALGRMLQIDPLAEKYAAWSPYNYAFNNPVSWNDPLGDEGRDALKFVMDLFDKVPWGQNQTFNSEEEEVERPKEGDGGGGCDYCPGAASNYPLYAQVSNKYGTWINAGAYWIDASSDEQRRNRITAQQEAIGDPRPEYGFGLNLNAGLGFWKGSEVSIGAWSGGPGSRGQMYISYGSATKWYLNASSSAQLMLLRSRSGKIDVSGAGRSWGLGYGDVSLGYGQSLNEFGDVSADVIVGGASAGLKYTGGVGEGGNGVKTMTWTIDYWSAIFINPLIGWPGK